VSRRHLTVVVMVVSSLVGFPSQEVPQKEVDLEVQKEYTRHREYLENTLHALRDR
jgi:hypothetical protein